MRKLILLTAMILSSQAAHAFVVIDENGIHTDIGGISWETIVRSKDKIKELDNKIGQISVLEGRISSLQNQVSLLRNAIIIGAVVIAAGTLIYCTWKYCYSARAKSSQANGIDKNPSGCLITQCDDNFAQENPDNAELTKTDSAN